MPQPENQGRPHKAVLWTAADPDAYARPTVEAPVELDVRWEETNREARDEKGNVVSVESMAVVDRDIATGSIMRLGALDDLPDTPDELRQVVGFEKVPDVKGRQYFRRALLVKYHDTLPAIAGT